MPNDDIDIDWGISVLIPEDNYQVVYVSHETTKGSFGSKVNITFRIITQGEYYETLINAHYNVKDGSKQQQLPELLWYSKVDSMIGQSDASELTSYALPKLEPKVIPVPIPELTPTIKSVNESQSKIQEDALANYL
jgi:hypothetical protein